MRIDVGLLLDCLLLFLALHYLWLYLENKLLKDECKFYKERYLDRLNFEEKLAGIRKGK